MARHGFYNSNEYRAFPFITPAYRPGAEELADPAALPTQLIVDCGVLLSPDAAAFSAEDPSVVYKIFLSRLSRDGDVLRFEFRCDAPGTAGFPLVFTRDVDDPEFHTSYAEAVVDEAASDSSSSASLDCRDGRAVWEGFLVTGDLTTFPVADGDELVFDDDDWQLEPCCAQNLSYLRSITLANYDRTRAMPDDECCSEASSDCSQDAWPLYVVAACLSGTRRFKEGYNIDIRQEDAANRIVISAAVGSGAGRGCDMPAVYPGEVPPNDSVLLGGGPTCAELITGLNGVGGRLVTIAPGPGIEITPSDATHTITIGVDFTPFGLCDGEEA